MKSKKRESIVTMPYDIYDTRMKNEFIKGKIEGREEIIREVEEGLPKGINDYPESKGFDVCLSQITDLLKRVKGGA